LCSEQGLQFPLALLQRLGYHHKISSAGSVGFGESAPPDPVRRRKARCTHFADHGDVALDAGCGRRVRPQNRSNDSVSR
jgi:hypothetical protein